MACVSEEQNGDGDLLAHFLGSFQAKNQGLQSAGQSVPRSVSNPHLLHSWALGLTSTFCVLIALALCSRQRTKMAAGGDA